MGDESGTLGLKTDDYVVDMRATVAFSQPMHSPTLEQISDIILNRRPVFSLDVDSLIRQAANRLTARALLELLTRMDVKQPEFTSSLSNLLAEVGVEDTILIGFSSGHQRTSDDSTEVKEPSEPSVHYLKLVFEDEQAAYYQFHLFPSFDAPYIMQVSRKRAGAVQHMRLELTDPGALQVFIEECRRNPHFLRVEESTRDEFASAPSHGV